MHYYKSISLQRALNQFTAYVITLTGLIRLPAIQKIGEEKKT